MTFFLFLVIILCSMGDVVFKNIFAKGEVCTAGDNHVYNAIACLIGAPLSLIGYGIRPVSSATVILALCYGFCMGFVAIFGIRSFKTGPMSLTSIFGTFSMIIPIMVGFVFWKEAVTFMKVAGILIMFAAIYLIISPSGDGKITKKWVFNVCIYALSTGLMTTFHQLGARVRPEESHMFLAMGFFFATVFICFNIPYCQKHPDKKITKRFFSMENLNGLFVGILGAINSICGVKILTLIDSTVFYPVKVGACLICNALLSFFLFHEKLGKKQVIGFILGSIAILILTIV